MKLPHRSLISTLIPSASLRVIIRVLPLLIIFFIFSFSFLVFHLFRSLPSPAKLSSQPLPQTTKIYDRRGVLLYNIYASQNRTPVPLSQIPDHLKKATIAIEDKDFYRHPGIDLLGITRALRNIIFHQKLQSGSTITQQLVKNSLLTPQRTLTRKIKEVILAFLVERRYSKDQILEMYLNQAPYGGTAWGVQAAAEKYFHKKVSELTLAESALLAGLPAAPTLYSPFGAHPELAKIRQKQVLQRMLQEEYITKDQQLEIENWQLKISPPQTDIRAPHFVMFVKEQLVEKYGQKMVEQGGLKVTTTLDLNLQDFTQETIATEVARQKKYQVGNAAALITKPDTGEILVMVGSKDYFATDSGNVNVALAQRSPGSAIKPLNYALAFLKKILTPATLLIDAPTCFPGSAGQKPYCPSNYDDRFHGPVQVRFALGNSYNIPAVKTLALNTVSDFIATASAMGITTFTDEARYGLSLTLGGGEVKMTDMATAFAVFANAGSKIPLVSILKVEDSQGKILEEYQAPEKLEIENWKLKIAGKRILPAEVAYLISHILLDDNSRQDTFGPGSYLSIPGVSVKTGTTEDKRDNWTIGYTPDFLAAVWVGNNDNTPMSPYLESGGSGAAPIWHKLMKKVLNGKPARWPEKPESITGLMVCSLSGKLPANDCPSRFEYFLQGTEPQEIDTGIPKLTIPIDANTNKQATKEQIEKAAADPSVNIKMEEHSVLSDPFTANFCADCPF